MQLALKVNNVDNSEFREKFRTGDGSFENDLKTAENKLNKKKTFDFPFDSLQNIFGFIPLHFDFRRDIEPIDPEKDKTAIKQNAVSKIKKQAISEHKHSGSGPNGAITIADTKAIKDALIKNMPSPIVPIIMPNSGTASNNPSSSPVSRLDVQVMIDKIIEQAKLIKTGEKVLLTLLLSDLELGQMSLSLESRNGMVAIQIATSKDTKESLDRHVHDIESALKAAHINFLKINIIEAAGQEKNC
ncbi:hypothetical protein HZC34_05105 [Candidatus Saganbacteria bacterium]|nr:hypothetical protein [Candidatus Saganbacteria bacterium]